MERDEKTVFLTAPAGMFTNVKIAKKCARSLQAFLKYMFKKENINGNSIMIGLSNVDGKKAHYVSVAHGVGRPQRVLEGDIENCFVDPHLHILVNGDMAEKISAKIITYLIKKSKEYGEGVGKRIWKQYIASNYDASIVEYYIEKQSFSVLGVNRYNRFSPNDDLEITVDIINEHFGDEDDDEDDSEDFINSAEISEEPDLFEYINEREEVSETGDNFDYEQEALEFDTLSYYNKNRSNIVGRIDVDYFIADLRTKWRYLQQMKRIAVELIANYEIAYYTYCLQNEICQIADAVKKYQSNIYINRIREITLKAEQIGTTIEVQKKAHELAFQKRTNLTSDDMYHLDYYGN